MHGSGCRVYFHVGATWPLDEIEGGTARKWQSLLKCTIFFPTCVEKSLHLYIYCTGPFNDHMNMCTKHVQFLVDTSWKDVDWERVHVQSSKLIRQKMCIWHQVSWDDRSTTGAGGKHDAACGAFSWHRFGSPWIFHGFQRSAGWSEYLPGCKPQSPPKRQMWSYTSLTYSYYTVTPQLSPYSLLLFIVWKNQRHNNYLPYLVFRY